MLKVPDNGSSGFIPMNSERSAGGMSICEREWYMSYRRRNEMSLARSGDRLSGARGSNSRNESPEKSLALDPVCVLKSGVSVSRVSEANGLHCSY